MKHFANAHALFLLVTDNTLNIKIVSTDGGEVFFKIKRTTKLNKLKVSLGSFTLQGPPILYDYADSLLPLRPTVP